MQVLGLVRVDPEAPGDRDPQRDAGYQQRSDDSRLGTPGQRTSVPCDRSRHGATGAVGDLMRKVLLERDFPAKSIKFLASERSAGKPIEYGGKR